MYSVKVQKFLNGTCVPLRLEPPNLAHSLKTPLDHFQGKKGSLGYTTDAISHSNSWESRFFLSLCHLWVNSITTYLCHACLCQLQIGLKVRILISIHQFLWFTFNLLKHFHEWGNLTHEIFLCLPSYSFLGSVPLPVSS